MTPRASTRDRVCVPRSQPTPGEGETKAAPGGPPSKWHIVGQGDGGGVNVSREVIEGLLARHEFFWLDLYRPEVADFKVLSDSFKFHPVAIQDSEAFGQRSKIDEYDDFSLIVVYGASVVKDRLVEVHCFYSSRFLITIHRDDCPALAELRERYRPHYGLAARPSLLLYRVIDSLVSSLFPLLSEIDDRIDKVQDEILLKASDDQVQQIFDMKRLLVGMRKTITPQRDAFASLTGRIAELPGFDSEDEHYFRDVYDHLIRISDLIDSYRDLLSSAMDVYMSTVSNRLNGVMMQLAIIATVFLPLTFITGFFGQNFAWLTGHMKHLGSFLVLGIGIELLAVFLLLALFKRRGWR